MKQNRKETETDTKKFQNCRCLVSTQLLILAPTSFLQWKDIFSPKFSCLQTHHKLSLFWILEKPEGWPGKIFADNFNFSLVYSTYFAVPIKMCPCLLSQKSDIKSKPIMKQWWKKNKDFERYLEIS